MYTVNSVYNIVAENKQSNENERTFAVSVNDEFLTDKLSILISERKNLQHVYCIVNDGDKVIFTDYYGNRYGRADVSFGKWFSSDDIKDGANKVVLPNYPYLFGSDDEGERFSIGDNIDICGKSYKAIGIGLLSEYVYQIPYNSIKDVSVISTVAVVIEKFGSQKEIESFSAYLKNLFDSDLSYYPQIESVAKSNRQFFLDTILIVGIMSLSVFNLVYLYMYILDKRKKEIAVNRISGQTIFSGVLNAYSEILIISTTVYIFCAVLMKLCVFRLLKRLGTGLFDLISFIQYLIVYLIFILICSLVFLPAIIRFMKKPPAEELTEI